MAIAFVSASTSTGNNPTSGNFPLGSFSNGDVAIFWWYSRSSAKTWTDNSGGKFTVLYEDAGTNGVLTILRRVLQTGDVATDFAWTSNSSANTDVIYGTIVFSGVDTTTPIDADSGTPADFTNTQSPNPPAVTVATDQAAVLTIFGKNNDYVGSITPPTNYTLDASASAESTAGADASGGVAYRLGLGTGSEDPGAWTLGGAAGDDGIHWTGALKPAAGGAAGQPTMRRWGAVPGLRVGGVTFGGGWGG